MNCLSTLFYLQYSIIKNYFKKKEQKKVIYISLVIVIPLILFSFFGFSFGYLIKSSHNFRNEINLEVLFYSLNTFILVLVIANILSRRKILKQITYRNLRFMPINFILFLIVDFIFSFFNKINLLLISLLLGLITGISSSAETFFILFLIIATLILLVHLLVELTDAIISIIRSRAIIFYLLLGITIAIFVIVNQSKLEQIIKLTPITFSIKTIVYFPLSSSFRVISSTILYNIISLLIGLLVYFSVKWTDYLFITKNSNQSTSPIKTIKKIRIVRIFNEDVSVFLLKDIKFIMRNNRSFSQIIFEILLVFIFTLSYYYNINIFPHNLYFTLFITIIFPVLMWDFYLSNQWGIEKKGFSFYLFAPVKFYNMILAKNLSYFIIKIPVLIISTLLFGYYVSVDIFPFVIFLQIILNLLLITIANYNSIRYPFPIDVSDTLLSQNSPNTKFSMLGFLGLLLVLIFSLILLFFLWRLNEWILTFIIYLVITLLSVFGYFVSLRSYSKYFAKQKEKMYNSLCENE